MVAAQRRLVESGFLGKKSGRGYYDYRDGAVLPGPAMDGARDAPTAMPFFELDEVTIFSAPGTA